MILLLGGTVDSRELAAYLTNKKLQILISTVSSYGGQLAETTNGVEVLTGALNEDKLRDILVKHNIKVIVDATHPYAVEISLQAMQASGALYIKYCRFERPVSAIKEELNQNKLIHYVRGITEAAECAAQLSDSVFLTIGSKGLERFLATYKPDQRRVTARVLPDNAIIEKCLNLGLQISDIIAMQGPFTFELNKAMFSQKGAQVLVTKDSGTAGGTEAKITAALDLGMHVIIIQRPNINYLNQYAFFEDIWKFIKSEVDE